MAREAWKLDAEVSRACGIIGYAVLGLVGAVVVLGFAVMLW